MFNPFDPDIYQKVVDSICITLNPMRRDPYVYLLCYGATINEYLYNKVLFRLIDSYTDDVRGTSVNIWNWERQN